ncbi:TVP38/TMEM64 family protein [Yonghaparkia sp. Soil809]|uniref:TVP38/TMEM64 family protein n=1 Tax=Yonghaparkia sp. Soil809 TaxID=1736417 RepID=UPI0009E6E1E3|nr:TVP38/TMEM64 family protein [Yonghaparkia sp. Soil809]
MTPGAESPPAGRAPLAPRGAVARAAALGVFVAVAVAVGVLVPLPSVDEVRAAVADLGPWGGVALALAYAAVTLTPAPKNVLSIAAGLAFGFWTALLWVYLGALIGAAVAFVLGRALGRDAVERFTGARVAAIDDLLARRGLLAVLGVRLVPVVPFTAINYVAGLTAVRRRDYAVGTVLGIIPGTVAYVALGAFGLELGWPVWVALGVLGALTLAGAVVAWRGRRRRPDARAARTDHARSVTDARAASREERP